MSADHADSQKADEEDRKSDHATLVAAKENEFATLIATIEKKENSLVGDETPSEWEERQKSRVESPQSFRRFLWPCDSTGGCAQRRGCGWRA